MTVTVCGVFQSLLVKVNDDGETVPSLVSLDDRPIVTFALGWLFSTTVNVAVPPASVVGPLGADTVTPDGFVVDVGDRHVGSVHAVVLRVDRGRRGGDDRIRDVAVGDVVVDAGHRDGLRRAPVRGS